MKNKNNSASGNYYNASMQIVIHGQSDTQFIEQLKQIIKDIKSGKDYEDCISGDDDYMSGYRYEFESH